jgi:hypothetical protein
MPFGMGPYGWFVTPYAYLYWRCRWLPWLPRWWWTGIYGPITWTPYGVPVLPKEQEIAMLEDHAKFLEEQLVEIRKRIEELKK